MALTRAVKGALLVSASAGLLMPNAVIAADDLPDGCSPDPVDANQTAVCLPPSLGADTGPISTTVDDLTIVIGSESLPTSVVGTTAGAAVRMTGNGSQTLTVLEGSSITGVAGEDGVSIGVDFNETANVTVDSAGTIQAEGSGLNVFHGGLGAVDIDTAAVTGGSGGAIYASMTNASNTQGLAITSTDTLTTDQGHGISAFSNTLGALTIETAAVSGGDTGNEGSDLGIGIYAQIGNESNAEALSITSTGTVEGPWGIAASHAGLGALNIQTADVTGEVYGITASITGTENEQELSVTSTGHVQGAANGIIALHRGLGAIDINAAAVTAVGHEYDGYYYGTGISAYLTNTANTESLTVTATGAVTGYNHGVNAGSRGLGAVDINTAAVSSTYGAGIQAVATNENNEETLSITSTGTVTGKGYGIYATHGGLGALSIETAAVTGTPDEGGGAGIYARLRNDSNSQALTVTATGTVQGQMGIDVAHSGLGAIDIDTAAVNGYSYAGISADANNESNEQTLSITATGTVQGRTGIDASHSGLGAIDIDTATVSATGYRGISVVATNANNEETLAITSTGTVSSSGSGVSATHSGLGALTIETAAVTGSRQNEGTGFGIFANIENDSNAEALTVTATGTVQGEAGIDASHSGLGALTIETAAVSGTDLSGISAVAENVNNTQTLSITSTGAVTGRTRGVSATHSGLGALTIETAAVTGGTRNEGFDISSDGAIYARIDNEANAQALTVTATGAVQGRTGIDASHSGLGAIDIDTAAVSSGYYSGIRAVATNENNEQTLSITSTGEVSGGSYGISATHRGLGAIDIDTAAVSGADNYAGISASVDNVSSEAPLSITSTGTVSGSSRGIFASHYGLGALTIETAAATGGTPDEGLGTGIYARLYNDSNAEALSVTAAGTVAGQSGIDALHAGLGALNIQTAAVTADIRGITAIIDNVENEQLLSVTSTGHVQGAEYGVDAVHRGLGAIDINVAAVTAVGYEYDGSYYGTGIFAYMNNFANTESLTVTATGAVMGYSHGVDVGSRGFGAVDINTAAVSSTYGAGIRAAVNNLNNEETLSITSTGTVTGYGQGISATHRGLGALTIETAAVTSTPNEGAGAGIYASLWNESNSEALTVTATGTVQGQMGIDVAHSGLGAIDIDTAAVSAGYYSGIRAVATNANNEQTLSITSTGAVSGGSHGISATHHGLGALTIETAAVSGGTPDEGIGTGIHARTDNEGNAQALTVTATGAVEGQSGIDALHSGLGAIDIDTAAVSATDQAGILAVANNASNERTLSITSTGAITGGTHGIRAVHDGLGAVEVYAAAVNADAGNGIHASIGNATNAEALSITSTGAVEGGVHGIFASHAGSGALTITAADAVTGGTDGIRISRAAAGTTELRFSGAVSGLDQYGVYAVTPGGVAIVLDSGASVSGGTAAIVTGDAADVLTTNDGASIVGTAMLGDGNDTFNVSGGTFSDVRGGGGTDTVNFSGSGFEINGSGGTDDVLSGFEIFNFNGATAAVSAYRGDKGLAVEMFDPGVGGGYVLSGTHSGLQAVNFNGGNTVLSGSLQAATATIGNGASLAAEDGAALSGSLTNAGTLVVAGSGEPFRIGGDFTQTEDGTLILNTASNALNTLAVSGDASLAGNLVIDQSQAPLGDDNWVLLQVGGTISGEFDSISGASTSEGLLISRTLDYSGGALTLQQTLTPASEIAGLTTDDIAVADTLLALSTTDGVSPGFVDLALAIGGIGDVETLASALNEFRPEAVDAGLQAFRAVQQRNLLALMEEVSVADGPRGWTSLQYGSLEGSTASGDFDSSGFDIAAGVSGFEFGAVKLGAALGYSDYDTDAQGADEAGTDMLRIAAFAGTEINPDGRGINARLDGGLQYAAGANDISMAIAIPAASLDIYQQASSDVTGASGVLRLTVDGWHGNEWRVKPHVLLAGETVSQDALTIGDGATAVAVESVDADRFTVGYGASIEFDWQQSGRLYIGATALEHSGDTANSFSAELVGAGVSGTPFAVTGEEVKSQYLVEGIYERAFGDNWLAALSGHSEFGDLEGLRVQFRVSRKF